ncbi:MAG: dimethyl sulfoxide reductase anchor subunit [Gammaproteobacteria bacterium]|nr:dimethyl sulfoxide reductase anchor subunit [Gammaproteobacteria bacterium]
MNPALSVILFTTLSGAGYGLLAWSAVVALGGWLGARSLLAAALFALVLVTLGLLSSLAHLGQPQRAWRAFSQWRTSWLSREGVAAVLTYVPALLFCALLLPGRLGGPSGDGMLALNMPGMLVCVALAVCALATLYCTAMIYASLKPIPAWRHRLVVPGYFGFALLGGGLLLAAIASLSGAAIGNGPAIAGLVLAATMAALKLRYWRDIDATPLPLTRGAAVGLSGREVSVFERPHTQANYITREMAFVIARRHSRGLRWLAIAMFALLPMLCMLPAWLFVRLDAAPWFAVAAIGAMAGIFVERWLFFAEARHLVTLYY